MKRENSHSLAQSGNTSSPSEFVLDEKYGTNTSGLVPINELVAINSRIVGDPETGF